MKTIEINREELAAAYESKTIEEVMKQFGFRNPPTLYRMLDKAGIPRKEPNKSEAERTHYRLTD